MVLRSLLRIVFLAAIFFLPGRAPAEETQRWGAALNPTGEAPLGAFKAVYINTQNPRKIVATETVPDIAINYSYDKFFGINSEDFGAYWVGRIKVPRDEQRTMELSLSWSQVRVFIDGRLVHEGDADLRKPIMLAQGIHLVEVEFINNWHTTSFRAAFKKDLEPLGRTQILERLRARNLMGAQVYYVGVYESSAKDLSIRLDVGHLDKPIILVLSASDSVKWVVNEAHRGNISAVIYGGHKPGSDVQGVDESKTLVLPLAGSVGSFNLEARCSCRATQYHCESEGDLLRTQAEVEALTGARLAAFSGKYSADGFVLPGVKVDGAAQQLVRASELKRQAEREQCMRKSNPDFNKMFEKKGAG